VRFNAEPVQTGLLLPAVGAGGGGLTITAVVPAALVHPPRVTVTEYVPASARTEVAIEGVCEADVKALGPVQVYVAPPTGLVLRLIAPPKHTGLLLLAAGTAGIGLTVTTTVWGELGQPVVVPINV
jgi:hypothetical protein